MGDLLEERGVGVLGRVRGVDALDAVLGHQDGLGMDLRGAQRGGRVGGEERVARAGGEDHHAPLLEVADGPAPDVRLGHLGDRDGRLHARVHPRLLQGVLEGERVEDRGHHAHVVRGRAVHARGGAGHAAVDVAGAHHDRHLDAALAHARDLRGDGLDLLRIGAVVEVAEQRLAGELEQDALERGRV